MAELKASFLAFASVGAVGTTEMDSKAFLKMLTDSKVISKQFTNTDSDILFTKVKTKGARRITFAEFSEKALPDIATKLKATVEEVATRIANASPALKATKVEKVQLHDDKSLYTGVYAQGGPTNVDRDSHSLAGVVDRRVDTVDNRGTTVTQK